MFMRESESCRYGNLRPACYGIAYGKNILTRLQPYVLIGRMYVPGHTRAKAASQTIGGLPLRALGLSRDLLLLGAVLALLLRMGAGAG